MSTSPIALLREDLAAADYTVGALSRMWGDEAQAALHRNQRVPARRVLDRLPTTPAGTLARVFLIGDAVSVDDLDAALPRLRTDGAVELGLVESRSDGIRPRRDLRPYAFVDALGEAELWIVSDVGELMLEGALSEDHVLGVGGASLTLAGLAFPERVHRVLDIGTGCGIQALHAARHADAVVATDISLRALEFAAFNAELNGVRNIEFRHGSLFEPVEGERFDRIVSNPPFVITPRREGVPEYDYRDGGLTGDEIVREVLMGCAAHLAPGGTVQMLGNWESHSDSSGRERVLGWLDELATEGTPLDAWIIEREVQSPEEYAETWIRDGGTRQGTPEFDALYDAWLDDFEERDVRSVGFGYVILRAPTAEPRPRWNRFERLQTAPALTGPGLGAHLAACVAAHDLQAGLTDEELAGTVLTVARDVTEERHLWPGTDEPTAIILRQGGGFARAIPADTALAALVGACDGDLPVGVIVAAIAELLDVDPAALRAQLLRQVRELIDDGMLHIIDAA